MKRLLTYLFLALGLLWCNSADADKWTAIFTHPKSTKDFISLNNIKSEALKKAKINCLNFVHYSFQKK